MFLKISFVFLLIICLLTLSFGSDILYFFVSVSSTSIMLFVLISKFCILLVIILLLFNPLNILNPIIDETWLWLLFFTNFVFFLYEYVLLGNNLFFLELSIFSFSFSFSSSLSSLKLYVIIFWEYEKDIFFIELIPFGLCISLVSFLMMLLIIGNSNLISSLLFCSGLLFDWLLMFDPELFISKLLTLLFV